jgi:hypothetical protein
MEYTVRKCAGNDMHSWAVFRKREIRGRNRRVIMPGQAVPVVSGCSRAEANSHKRYLERR